MAQRLRFDDGILELEINDRGLLRFNASDPNVYQRFLGFARELLEMEKSYTAQLEKQTSDDAGGDEEDVDLERISAPMDQLKQFDRTVKERLAFVFGPENDFDQLLGGVNLMAFGRNGERVITNLLEALRPYLEAGAKQHREREADTAVSQAKWNRAQRRARQ